MRVFKEALTKPYETVLTNRGTIEKRIFLDEILFRPNSLVVSKQDVRSSSPDAEIFVTGVMASSSHPYYSTYRADYGYLYPVPVGSLNIIQISFTSVESRAVEFDLLINDALIDHMRHEEDFNLDTVEKIYIDITGLELNMMIKRPHLLRAGDLLEISQMYYTQADVPTEKNFFFDEVNYCLIFDRELSNVQILTLSVGSMLRATSLNEVLRLNKDLPCLVDPENLKIIIPDKFIIPRGSSIEIVDPQEVRLEEDIIPVNYSFIGIYIRDGILRYEILEQRDSYSALMSAIKYYYFEYERDYLAFLTVFNSLASITILDFLPMGFGQGGGGNVRKRCTDLTEVTDVTVTVTGGSTAPVFVFYDDDGHQIIPEDIWFDYNSQVIVSFGDLFSGRMCVL